MIMLDHDIHEPMLRMVCTAVDKRNTLPVLSNVLLRASDGLLHLTGTNLEISITAAMRGSDDVEAELTLPAHKLLSILKAAPPGQPIKLDHANGHASLSAGRSRWRIGSLPAADFPDIDSPESAMQFQVPGHVLSNLLNVADSAQAVDDARYYLNGVLMEFDGQILRAVATDGHRLHLAERSLGKPVEQRQIIVPRLAVAAIRRLSMDCDITLVISDTSIQVHSGALRLSAKLIDGKYPDYQKVIPSGDASQCRVDRAALYDAIKRSLILSDEKYHGVKLTFHPDHICIESSNNTKEESYEEVHAQYDGETMEIAFNATYIVDALDAISQPDLTIDVFGKQQPIVIRPSEGQYTPMALVMQMRL